MNYCSHFQSYYLTQQIWEYEWQRKEKERHYSGKRLDWIQIKKQACRYIGMR